MNYNLGNNFICQRTCNHLLKSTCVAVTGTAPNQVLTITIPEKHLENLENYYLIICQRISVDTTIPVVVSNGTTILPLICNKGNIVRADQIKTRYKYCVTYGNDHPHIMINNCIPKTGYKI